MTDLTKVLVTTALGSAVGAAVSVLVSSYISSKAKKEAVQEAQAVATREVAMRFAALRRIPTSGLGGYRVNAHRWN